MDQGAATGSSDGTAKGQTVGIVFGVLGAVCGLLVCVFLLHKKFKNNQREAVLKRVGVTGPVMVEMEDAAVQAI